MNVYCFSLLKSTMKKNVTDEQSHHRAGGPQKCAEFEWIRVWKAPESLHIDSTTTGELEDCPTDINSSCRDSTTIDVIDSIPNIESIIWFSILRRRLGKSDSETLPVGKFALYASLSALACSKVSVLLIMLYIRQRFFPPRSTHHTTPQDPHRSSTLSPTDSSCSRISPSTRIPPPIPSRAPVTSPVLQSPLLPTMTPSMKLPDPTAFEAETRIEEERKKHCVQREVSVG
ncbi:hypothetical protein GCK72_022490 [Caenorhabditis remanei]|uniref:Uncharacterized protein n=1 Tax=Caenorhabditis remanei TaxID=31234 RepID=A0A6A5FU81_CAERE|nr:hypothetical protein GCK72_022490 [Caenorhabditis remanei]KAF1746039.1 hypothetical protein GCK72_022490 [Caenorhabditis remanei]